MPEELQRLNPRHHKILELYLQGFKPGEMADQLEISRPGVTWVVASAPFQHELSRRRKDRENVHDQMVASTVGQAKVKLERAAEGAVDRLIEHSESQDARVSLMSIKEILDRAGCVSAKAQGGGGLTVQILSPERVQLLMQSINESKEAAA